MKSTAKKLAQVFAGLLVSPCIAAFWLAARLWGRQRVFPTFSQWMSLFPGPIGYHLRRAFYRVVLPECGEDACISFGTVFSHATATVGRKAYVGVYCVLGDVSLEDDVLVGSRVSIINGNQQHGTSRLDIPVREQPGRWPRVTIGRDSWIGDGAIVMADVGRHCVVGAGSVVTRPLPDYAVALGNPARIVRYRNCQQAESTAAAGERNVEMTAGRA